MVAKMAVKKQEKILSEDEESWASAAEEHFGSDGAEEDQMEGDDWEEGDAEDLEDVKEDGEPAIKRAKTETERKNCLFNL